MTERRLVWLDLETTGLDPERNSILEIGAILTDGDLSEIDSFHRVVKASEEAIDGMNEWCQRVHGRNGLAAEALKSDIDIQHAESEMIGWLTAKHGLKHHTAVLAGNTIHFDRRFIIRWMPRLDEFLHYRLLDVTSVREFVKRALPESHVVRRRATSFPGHEGTHRAMDDIRASIEEAMVYIDLFKAVGRGFEVGALCQ